MTSVERVYIPQKAILWEKAGRDNYGQVTVSAGIDINVEWPQNIRESRAENNTNESKSDEVIVNQAISIGSILYFGELETYSGTDPDLFQVVDRSSQPDLKGRSFRRTITVTRYGNSLPTIV